jgi:hypothetical protein
MKGEIPPLAAPKRKEQGPAANRFVPPLFREGKGVGARGVRRESKGRRSRACSSHCWRIAFLCLYRKQGKAIHALPARPAGRPIDGQCALLGPRLTACPRVWQLSGVLFGLPLRLAGNVRPPVHERSAALPACRAALHALRMQLQLAKGMELRWALLSAAGQEAISAMPSGPARAGSATVHAISSRRNVIPRVPHIAGWGCVEPECGALARGAAAGQGLLASAAIASLSSSALGREAMVYAAFGSARGGGEHAS